MPDAVVRQRDKILMLGQIIQVLYSLERRGYINEINELNISEDRSIWWDRCHRKETLWCLEVKLNHCKLKGANRL